MNRRRLLPRDSPTPAAPIPLPTLLDRALVGVFVALVVARLIVPGDDPGRLRLTSGGGAVSFNLCVLVVLLGAIVWRIAYGRGRLDWSAALVPLLLACVGVTAYVSSQLGDRYARPGLYIAWEWMVVAAAVYLTRRLASSVADSRGVLNVLLATAVCVAGQGLYQQLGDRINFPAIDVVAPPTMMPLAGDDEFYPELNRRPLSAQSPRGTLDSPATLLAFLLLMLPAAVTVARVRHDSRWSRFAIAIPILLVAAALAALLVGPFEWSTKHWSAATRLISEYPALGVGPGNFSRFAPEVVSPGNACLALAATTGLIGFALFAAALVMTLLEAVPSPAPNLAVPPIRGTRWEFYLGGMVGLIMGFVWSAGELPAEVPPSEVFKLGGAAILRAILWFASFALLEILRPAPRGVVQAILIGVCCVLVLGQVSDAPGLPTILFPMWVMLGLAMNFRRPELAVLGERKWTRPVLVLAALAAIGLVFAYLVMAALPAWSTASAVRHARMTSRYFWDKHREFELAPPGPARANAVTVARSYLVAAMLEPLAAAVERDSTNAALWLETARWRRPQWQYQLLLNPEDAARVADETRKAAERAAQLDSRNLAAKRNLFEALLLYRGTSTARQPERIAALNKLIGQIAEREPQSEVPLRYRVVKMLLDRGETEVAEPEVATLLRLDTVAGEPHGRLTDEQKRDVSSRSATLPKKGPK